MSYTDAQLESLRLAKRRLSATGKPEVIAQLNFYMAQEAPYEKLWAIARADLDDLVKPEKPTDVFEPPPVVGRGSGTDDWRDFAKKVSDIDPEVIMAMGRNDLIKVLADRGIIEAPAFILGE